jgi:hypothetical protein
MYLLIKFIAQELQSSERNQGKQYLIWKMESVGKKDIINKI